jgi:hypothetical protein
MDHEQIRVLLADARIQLRRPEACPPGWACLDHERIERLAGPALRAVNAFLGAHGGVLDMVPGAGPQTLVDGLWVTRRLSEVRVVYVHPDALAAPPLADAA